MAKLQELALKYWWVVVLPTIALLWLHEHDAAVAARAEAKQQTQQILEMAEQLGKFDRELSRRDSILTLVNKQLLAANAKIESEQRVAQQRVNASVESLRAELTVEQQQKFDSVVNGFRTIIMLSDTRINNLTTALKNDSILIADKDTLLANYRNQNGKQLDQLVKMSDLLAKSGESKFERWVNRAVTIGAIVWGVTR